MVETMKWTSALSSRPSLEAAVQEVVTTVQEAIAGPMDVGIVFISSAFASEYARLMPLLQEKLTVPVLIGCSGGGIVGMTENGAKEIEANVALSLSVGQFPGVSIKPFLISPDDLPDLDGPPKQWTELIGVNPEENPDFILLADPMAGGLNDFLQGMDFAYPGTAKVGGLASAGSMSARTCVFYQDDVYFGDIVGIALSGNIKLDTIVAQGCRPIGPVYRVTEGERNVILELQEVEGDNTSQPALPPLKALQNMLDSLNEEDREKIQNSLFVGIAQSEFKATLEPGDFLIRQPMGIDPRVGALAIGDRVRPGQRIQFHLRDAQTSADDLDILLKRYKLEQSTNASGTVGALMFACLGRGESLYDKPDFDSGLFTQTVPHTPISGFFCNGEIGPVGGTSFIHGFTSVFGILRQP